MLTIGNIRRSCRCLIISMVFKHGVCFVNCILLISDIILFIYSFHYITFHFTIFWSFHNSFLVTCPSSFLFHILFDFYVPSTYCTTTFYLDLEMDTYFLQTLSPVDAPLTRDLKVLAIWKSQDEFQIINSTQTSTA